MSRRGLLLAVTGVTLAAGCSAGTTTPSPTPGQVTRTPIPATTPAGPVTVPDDGVSLADLGFRNGPVEQFSLPRSAVLGSLRVDQPNQLTMTIGSPPTAEVIAYLVETIPAAGFTIVDHVTDADGGALIALGYGWEASLVSTPDGSALTLQVSD